MNQDSQLRSQLRSLLLNLDSPNGSFTTFSSEPLPGRVLLPFSTSGYHAAEVGMSIRLVRLRLGLLRCFLTNFALRLLATTLHLRSRWNPSKTDGDHLYTMTRHPGYRVGRGQNHDRNQLRPVFGRSERLRKEPEQHPCSASDQSCHNNERRSTSDRNSSVFTERKAKSGSHAMYCALPCCALHACMCTIASRKDGRTP